MHPQGRHAELRAPKHAAMDRATLISPQRAV
jgi:hypothetical protein